MDEDTNEEISPETLLVEAEIKKERMDEDTNEGILPFTQILVKNETTDKNCVPTRYRDVVREKPNNSTFGFLEINGKFLDEEGLYIRINKCMLCDLFIYQSLKEHTIECHQTGIFFTCPYCDWSSAKINPKASNEVLRHKKLFHIDCEFCGETLPNWIALTNHISNTHKNKTNNKCRICGYEAHSYSVLIQHVIIRHDSGNLTHNCQHCNYSTMNRSLFSYHIKAKHTDSGEAFPHTSSGNTRESIEQSKISKGRQKATKKCRICDFKTFHRATLARHMRRVHSDM